MVGVFCARHMMAPPVGRWICGNANGEFQLVWVVLTSSLTMPTLSSKTWTLLLYLASSNG